MKNSSPENLLLFFFFPDLLLLHIKHEYVEEEKVIDTTTTRRQQKGQNQDIDVAVHLAVLPRFSLFFCSSLLPTPLPSFPSFNLFGLLLFVLIRSGATFHSFFSALENSQTIVLLSTFYTHNAGYLPTSETPST